MLSRPSLVIFTFYQKYPFASGRGSGVLRRVAVRSGGWRRYSSGRNRGPRGQRVTGLFPLFGLPDRIDAKNSYCALFN